MSVRGGSGFSPRRSGCCDTPLARWEHDRQEAARLRRLSEVRSTGQSVCRPPLPAQAAGLKRTPSQGAAPRLPAVGGGGASPLNSARGPSPSRSAQRLLLSDRDRQPATAPAPPRAASASPAPRGSRTAGPSIASAGGSGSRAPAPRSARSGSPSPLRTQAAFLVSPRGRAENAREQFGADFGNTRERDALASELRDWYFADNAQAAASSASSPRLPGQRQKSSSRGASPRERPPATPQRARQHASSSHAEERPRRLSRPTGCVTGPSGKVAPGKDARRRRPSRPDAAAPAAAAASPAPPAPHEASAGQREPPAGADVGSSSSSSSGDRGAEIAATAAADAGNGDGPAPSAGAAERDDGTSGAANAGGKEGADLGNAQAIQDWLAEAQKRLAGVFAPAPATAGEGNNTAGTAEVVATTPVKVKKSYEDTTQADADVAADATAKLKAASAEDLAEPAPKVSLPTAPSPGPMLASPAPDASVSAWPEGDETFIEGAVKEPFSAPRGGFREEHSLALSQSGFPRAASADGEDGDELPLQEEAPGASVGVRSQGSPAGGCGGQEPLEASGAPAASTSASVSAFADGFCPAASASSASASASAPPAEAAADHASPSAASVGLAVSAAASTGAVGFAGGSASPSLGGTARSARGPGASASALGASAASGLGGSYADDFEDEDQYEDDFDDDGEEESNSGVAD